MRQVLVAILLTCAAGCGGGAGDHVSTTNIPPADMAQAPSDQSGTTAHVAKVSFHLTGVQ
jgi:hypothetical protein